MNSDLPVLSVAQMREADRYTIEKGTPSKELMRRAAQGVYDAYSGWKDHAVLIVCGSGNNGGDGFAAAGPVLVEGQFFHGALLVSSGNGESG